MYHKEDQRSNEMECTWNSDLPWLPEGEQDFPLGAKATSFLPSATELDINYDTSELPDWMESNKILGLADDGLFSNIIFPGQVENEQAYNGFINHSDNGPTIKPEDMLVPLSELQPEKYASPAIESPSIPKFTVKVKVVIPDHNNMTGYSGMPAPSKVIGTPLSELQLENYAAPAIGSQTFTESIPNIFVKENVTAEQDNMTGYSAMPAPSEVIGKELRQWSNNPSIKTVHSFEQMPNYNADELLNELVNLANNEPNGLTNLITSFDSSVQAGMDDLLSQLNTEENNQEMSDASEWPVEPTSPINKAPSPVPSVGSLSPQSTGDRSFHTLSPMYNINDAASPMYVINDASGVCDSSKELSFASLLSPASEASVSVSSPIVTDDEESDGDYSNIEMHSYSRSPRKCKANRKTSSKSGGAYPEGRKERKKEQNKQAALRYRQKKKQEDDVLMTEIHAEEKRQKKLKLKYSNLKQELSCLKKIMREVLIAKGTLSKDAFKK